MKYGRFVYYQPNEKDVKDQFGDCTIRALSKALNITWLQAFDLTIPICRREQVPNIFYAPAKIRNEFLKELGFEYHGISNKKGSKRPTIDVFAKEHETGTFIVNVANHEVAVVNGKYYDTWDSGNKRMYGYYERKQKNENDG